MIRHERHEGKAMTIDAPLLETDDAPPRRDLQPLLVPPAMLVAAAAMGVACHLHLGFSVEVAAAVGISLFCLMLMCHVLLRAADEAERAEEEAAERAAVQVSSPMPASEPAPRLAVPEIERPAPAAAVAPRDFDAAQAPVAVSASQPPPVQLPVPPAVPAAASGWNLRPSDLDHPRQASANPSERQFAELGQLRPTFSEHSQASAADSGAALPASREADRIDAILKRLARQIHAGATAHHPLAAPDLPALAPLPPAMAAPAPVSEAAASLEAGAGQNSETALASAVDALRSTAEAMRGAMDFKPGQPDPVSPAELQVAAVAEALRNESANVFLAPILGLSSEQARHFEVSVQLRAVAEASFDPRAVAGGAGLLPLLDALNVRHAAGFALKLERRGREGSVFSHVGGTSLESEQFVHDVAGRHAQGIADRMVLSFAQDEMRGLGPAQLAALGDLCRLGFRFALQNVADLDMDFEALNALGFEFVKLDAGVFLGGLSCSGEHIPAGDICRHFEDLGLQVIVSGIGDAATRDRMVGCGVTYGQGPLFGNPLPVPVAGAQGTLAA